MGKGEEEKDGIVDALGVLCHLCVLQAASLQRLQAYFCGELGRTQSVQFTLQRRGLVGSLEKGTSSAHCWLDQRCLCLIF